VVTAPPVRGGLSGVAPPGGDRQHHGAARLWDDRDVNVRFGAFELDDQRFVLTGPEGPVHVERQVFEVLRYLILHRDRVVPKEELLDTIWGDRFVSESALTSRIKAARRAIGDDGTAQRLIKTVHGRGYHFIGEVIETPAATDAPAPAPVTRSLPRLRIDPLGRDDDLAALAHLMRDREAVTITGTGGVGKTTLAVTAARRLADQFDDGATFVDLIPVDTGGDVTRAVAASVGVEGEAATSVERLAAHLAHRPLLLVLDNCEHVLESARRLVDLMLEHGCIGRVLATSREPLDVEGEQLWPLGPLGDAGPLVFVERAAAVEPRVDWQADDPLVVSLCARLDNLPLALELAAGQLRHLSLDDLMRGLDEQLRLPASSRSTAERHSTTDATVEWSYRLLDDAEQLLLRHLSVFPASFDLEGVLGSSPTDRTDTARLLAQLVDKSLVARELWSNRYRLLEIIRRFASERLHDAGETADAVERHRRHYLGRVVANSRTDRWLSATLAGRYRTELDHHRQALRASLERGAFDDAVEIAVGASFLWRNTIGCVEGNSLASQLLELELDPRDRLWVHILRADVGQGTGAFRQMADGAREALALASPNDLDALCIAEHYAAIAHLTDPDASHAALAPATEHAHASGDQQLQVLLAAFGAVADLAAADHASAHARLGAIEQLASTDGYDRFIVHWAGWLLALDERNAADARRWMSVQEQFLERTGIVETWLSYFSSVMADVSDGLDPHPQLGRVLTLADREGHDAEPDCVLVLAFWAVCAERYEEAAELLGTAVHGRFNATAHYVLYRTVLHRAVTAHLTVDELRAAMTRGAGRTPGEVLVERGVARSPR
jgi:predicted ATPase/DNA-binding winged helix-turn-helix (wHTH) protein